MNIAFNNFVTNSFINELKHEGISEIFIEDFLNKILNNNGIIYIANYVESISIDKLVNERKIVVEEYEYDKMVITLIVVGLIVQNTRTLI